MDNNTFNEKSYEYEFEEEFNQERMSNPEQGNHDVLDYGDDIDENLDPELTNTAKRVLALDKRDEYERSSDYVWDYLRHNGIWGFLNGAIKSLAAIIGETVHVLVSNIVMGQHERFDFKRAVKKAIGAESVKEERKRIKTMPHHDEGQKQKMPEKRKTEEKQAVDHPERYVIDYGKQELPEAALEIETKINEVLNSKDKINHVIDACLQEPAFQNIFREINVLPVNDRESNKLLLFSCKTEMDMEKILCVDKEALLKGEAETLGKVLFHYRKKDSPEDKIVSVIEAVIASAKFQNEMHKEDYNQARQDIADGNDSVVYVSSVTYDTEENTKATLSAVLSEYRDSVDIYYNNKMLGTIDLTDPINAHIEQVQNKITEAQESSHKKIYQLDREVSFVKENYRDVTIVIGGESHSFRLETEKDMKAIADYLEEKCPQNKEYAPLNALLIGATVNPMMKRYVDEYGFELNPFTGEKKHSGDLIIEHKNDHVYISQYHLKEIPSQQTSMQIREDNERLVWIKPYGLSMDYEEMRETLKAVKPEPENTLDEYVQPLESTERKNSFQQPMFADGHKCFQELKKMSEIDNSDISFLRFHQSHDEKYKTEQNLGNKFQSYEEFAQEIDDQIQSYDGLDISAFNQTGFTVSQEVQEEYAYER